MSGLQSAQYYARVTEVTAAAAGGGALVVVVDCVVRGGGGVLASPEATTWVFIVSVAVLSTTPSERHKAPVAIPSRRPTVATKWVTKTTTCELVPGWLQ